MIGIIDCRSKDPGQTWAGHQPEMLEFFDRPLLQHAVEQMVQNHVDHCVLITEDTSAVMNRWGTGERWGCTFSAITPQAIIQFLIGLEDQTVMVGRGDCIPCISNLIFDEVRATTLLVFHEVQEPGRKDQVFTGWAMTRPHVLLNQCFATHGADGLLLQQGTAAFQTSTCIRCDTPQAFLGAQEAVLEAVESAVIFHGMQIRNGVWAARNVSLDSTTQFIGKVYLGENVRIGANVLIVGPVVISRDSAIDAGAVITNSCIQPATYLGRSMSLKDDVVIGDCIIRSRFGTVVKPGDPGKLSSSKLSLRAYVRQLFSTRLLGDNPA